MNEAHWPPCQTLAPVTFVGLQMVPVQIPVSLEWCAQPDLHTNLIARFTTVFKTTSITSSKDESPFRGAP